VVPRAVVPPAAFGALLPRLSVRARVPAVTERPRHETDAAAAPAAAAPTAAAPAAAAPTAAAPAAATPAAATPAAAAVGDTVAPPPRSGWLEGRPEWQVSVGVVVFALLLYLPFAGTYGLYDPWETHYGEVARQMNERGDYISLWWPGSPKENRGGEFWSKPVLSFWVMCFSMKAFGLGDPARPDEMVSSYRPEWALRLPSILFAVLAVWCVYYLLARLRSRRAGVLGALMLATSPLFFLVARQAMTDMPFVGPMTAALCFTALALLDRRGDDELRRARFWPHEPLFYVTLGLTLVTVVPQLVHDTFGLARNPIFLGTIKLRGSSIVPVYGVIAAVFVVLTARARVRRQLWLHFAFMMCALSSLAKGAGGLLIPVAIVGGFVLVRWEWRRLAARGMPSGLLVGVLGFVAACFPWYHAMLVRHGIPFWNELMGDNHLRRMFTGRHGDKGSFDYFLRELGYAIFPWIGMTPLAIWFALRRGRTRDDTGNLLAFGLLWALGAWAVVAMMMTKFHHYILPAIPGLAILFGVLLDRLVEKADGALTRDPAEALPSLHASLGLPGVGLLTVVAWDLINRPQAAQLWLWLFTYDYINSPRGRLWPVVDGQPLSFVPGHAAILVLAAAAVALIVWPRVRRAAVLAFAGVAVVFTFYLLDHFLLTVTPNWSLKQVIASYYRNRGSANEPLIAWQMYWRGETFYSKNQLYESRPGAFLPEEERTVFLDEKNVEHLQAYIKRNTGKRAWFVIESGRYGTLQGLLPENAKRELRAVDKSNNKFMMLSTIL
jgi:4-amino-4-deoxy-L-arabinose transferase-like glycosyltransferase